MRTMRNPATDRTIPDDTDVNKARTFTVGPDGIRPKPIVDPETGITGWPSTPLADIDTPADEAPDGSDGPDMTEWSEADKAAYVAVRLAAEEEERALAEEEEAHEGTPAQRAIAAERQRVERARKERERIKRESIEKSAREGLRKQYGDGVIFYPTKMGMVAARVWTEKEVFDNQKRIASYTREADKNATFRDQIRDIVLYPARPKFEEIAKKYPTIWHALEQELTEALSARDYTARPYD